MFVKKVEKFLENVAVKHATSASSLVFYEPKVPKKLMQIIKKESK
ncbi:cyclic lactone autoinducer peptide [Butyribacter sp.]|nr:cyclic lactone autoinducer peptide [Butyribacter sp.]